MLFCWFTSKAVGLLGKGWLIIVNYRVIAYLIKLYCDVCVCVIVLYSSHLGRTLITSPTAQNILLKVSQLSHTRTAARSLSSPSPFIHTGSAESCVMFLCHSFVT